MTVLLRREPWGLLGQLQHNIDDVFRQHQASTESNTEWAPAVDIREENDKYLLYVDIPGVDPKNIDLTIEQGYLTIKGSRAQRTSEEKAAYQKTECSFGHFVRRFKLPDSVDSAAVVAKGEHGVLEITVPKVMKATPIKIQVTH